MRKKEGKIFRLCVEIKKLRDLQLHLAREKNRALFSTDTQHTEVQLWTSSTMGKTHTHTHTEKNKTALTQWVFEAIWIVNLSEK